MIEVRDLVKVYPGPVAALKGVNLTLPHGLYGLLGPNGSGKSTLMKILAGLLEPTSGSVLKDGVDVTQAPERLRARLGYLPQDFGFYPDLTGFAMLRHLLILKGIESPLGLNGLCDALLDRVNLTPAASRKVKTYSGGMRQRLGIAQAIAGDPDLVIVDEPTAGLDPEERIRFAQLLSDLARDRTVLLSTHLVEDVAALCPRFAVIRYGCLIADTTPREALASVSGSMFEGDVGPDELDRWSSSVSVTQIRFVEGRVVARIQALGGEVPPRFEPVAATLEDAYLVLTKRHASTDANPGSVASAA